MEKPIKFIWWVGIVGSISYYILLFIVIGYALLNIQEIWQWILTGINQIGEAWRGQ